MIDVGSLGSQSRLRVARAGWITPKTRMRIYHVIWKDRFLDKMAEKHNVTMDEVEEVLFSKPHIRRAEKGRVKDEDLYAAYGQTRTGRYLIVFFIHKHPTAALPISARDMSQAERRYYDDQKKAR